MKNTSVGLATFAVASTVAVTEDIDAKATSVESNVEINKILEDSTDTSVKEEFVEEETADDAEVNHEFIEEETADDAEVNHEFVEEETADATEVNHKFVEEVDVQHDIAEDVINEAHTELKTIETVKGQASNVTHN